MPAAIPLIAGAVVAPYAGAAAAFIGAIPVVAKVVGALAGGLIAFGTSKVLGLDEVKKQDAPGPEINFRGATTPIPVIYGRRKIACSFVQLVATGPVNQRTAGGIFGSQTTYTFSNQFLNVVGVWGEGEIDAVETIFFDDDAVWTSDPNRNIASGWTDGVIRVRNYVGTDDQTASADFLAELEKLRPAKDPATIWTANHRLRGVAYSWLRLGYNADAYPSGLPTITAHIRGRKVLDVRDGVRKWSKNPALCVYDYLTNERFGRGIDPADIDVDSFVEAANYCDERVFIPYVDQPPGGPLLGEERERYECDAILNPDATPLDNMRALLTSCRGMLIFSGGKYKLRCDRVEPATFDLTEDNIVGGWNIQLEGLNDRLNRVVAQFPNRNRKYTDDMRIVESAAFRAADGRVLEQRIDLPCTTDQFHAMQLAGIALRQSRYMIRLELTATIEALQVEVGDVVRVTHEVPGWVGKAFRVMAFERTPDNDCRLQLQEYAAEVYDVTSANDEDSEADTTLPDPRIVSAVEWFEIFQSTREVDGVAEPYWQHIFYPVDGDTNIETLVLQWRLTTDEAWTVVEFSAASPTGRLTPGSVYRTHEVPAIRGREYQFNLFAINRLGIAGPVATRTLSVPPDIPPAPPTHLRVAGTPAGIRINWRNGEEGDGYYVRVYVHEWLPTETAPSIERANVRATLAAQTYEHVTPGPRTCSVWVQAYRYPSALTTLVGPVTAQVGLPTYADNAAALAGGLLAGDMYLDGSGNVRVVA